MIGVFATRVLSKEEIMLETRGDLVLEQIDEFQEQLNALMDRDYQIISLDFAEVETLNSLGIGKMLLFRRILSTKGKRVRIRGCSEKLYRLFQTMNLEKLIDIVPPS